jgi:hypothetical protein
VIRLLDGTRAYVHAVIDNFSRRILAWHVAGAFAPGNSVAVLLAATQRVTVSQGVPVVLADAGVENVNAQVDALLATGALRRLLASKPTDQRPARPVRTQRNGMNNPRDYAGGHSPGLDNANSRRKVPNVRAHGPAEGRHLAPSSTHESARGQGPSTPARTNVWLGGMLTVDVSFVLAGENLLARVRNVL